MAQPGLFLMAHLLKDLEQLINALGKGADDTVCTIHLMICSLLEPHQPSQCKRFFLRWFSTYQYILILSMRSYVCLFWPGPARYNDLLSTKDARNNWEMTMATDIITHQLKVHGYVLAYLKFSFLSSLLSSLMSLPVWHLSDYTSLFTLKSVSSLIMSGFCRIFLWRCALIGCVHKDWRQKTVFLSARFWNLFILLCICHFVTTTGFGDSTSKGKCIH